MEVGLDRRRQILEHTPPLLRTGRDHRPDPLAPAVARRAACPLRYVPINHHEADGLLRQVVRRPQPRRRYEPEIALPILLQPFLQFWLCRPAGTSCVPARSTARRAPSSRDRKASADSPSLW